jgi:hypothetical protein
MIDVAYILNSFAWSFVGAAAVLIYQRLGEGRSMAIRHDDGRRFRWPRPNWVLVVALVILVFSVVSTLVSWNVERDQEQFAQCQATVNQARTNVLNEIFVIAQQDRAAVDDLVSTVANAMSREEVARAFKEYRTTRDRLEKERRERPLPQPENLCGHPPA